MTALQMHLNSELFGALQTISDDEDLMKKAVRALKRIAKQKNDPTLLTKEEFFASLDRGEEEYRQGKTHRINSVDELKSFLNSL